VAGASGIDGDGGNGTGGHRVTGLDMVQDTTQVVDQLAQLQGGLDTPLAARLMGIVGIATMIGIAFLMSANRKRINWRLIGMGLSVQLVLGVLILKTTAGRTVFEFAGRIVTGLLGFSREGARFIFGNLIDNQIPVGVPDGAAGLDRTAGFVAETMSFFAFSVLPTIIFFSSLMTVLYYLGIMQRVVKGIAWVMQKTLGTSGAETLSAAGNIFMGQTEAPLLIKPFVNSMTRSELTTVMVGGFATVAGGVLAAYVGFLQGYFPSIAAHLLAASVMNMPAGIVISKILVPELDEPVTKGSLRVHVEKKETGVIDAAASGAGQGLQLALNVGAMLLAFVALVAMVDFGLGWFGGLFGQPQWSLQYLLGLALRPLVWLMGVPWQDAGTVGGLVGIKIGLNEFFAYIQFAGEMAGHALQPRSAVITTYALLGFANFSSIAIQIGGIGGLAPDRRHEIAGLGLRAMIGGNLAAFMSASLAGMLA
jgi:CNT family concentrative nucleoside transporter